jgi:diguanylate cyclase (GGDEF)-like protein
MRAWRRHPSFSLTQKVALLSLVPIVALGVTLALILQAQVVKQTLTDADESAQLIARIGVQPQLSKQDLKNGLTQKEVRKLDEQLSGRSSTKDLARLKIWNTKDRVIYSDDKQLIGRTLDPSDDLLDALAGHPHPAEVVDPRPHTETASEVGLGRLVEVYVPLRFAGATRPEGAFEIYLSYRPLATAIAHDKRTIALVVFLGLALLWAVLFRIVAGASRRLRKQARENYRLARYDQLTGLPNRTLFIERLAEHLRQAEGRDEGTAVLLLDLDGFKEINDTLGYGTGDAVLCEIGARLRSALGSRDQAFAARLGEDEYAVMWPAVADAAAARALGGHIQARLQAPLALHGDGQATHGEPDKTSDRAHAGHGRTLDGGMLHIEASVGVAISHTDELGVSPETLLQRADMALYRAKSNRSRIEVYSPEHDRFDASRLALLGQVRPALERGELILHYQPQAEIASGRIVGVEALLRWRHPERGLLAPAEFVPLIEQTSLVGPVTLYVIDRALQQAARWRELGLELTCSVNLSARNLLDPELPDQVEALLHKHCVQPRELTVEVTESATMADPGRAGEVLERLRTMAVGVSIDDFGSGHASIAYLARLPVGELKIDRSFVTDICESPRDEAIVRTTIDLARHLGLRIVAEGIETRQAWERLQSLGCDVGQGYLIGRPMPASELTDRLLAQDAEEGWERPRDTPASAVAHTSLQLR